jgi:hypothetical protein
MHILACRLIFYTSYFFAKIRDKKVKPNNNVFVKLATLSIITMLRMKNEVETITMLNKYSDLPIAIAQMKQ